MQPFLLQTPRKTGRTSARRQLWFRDRLAQSYFCGTRIAVAIEWIPPRDLDCLDLLKPLVALLAVHFKRSLYALDVRDMLSPIDYEEGNRHQDYVKHNFFHLPLTFLVLSFFTDYFRIPQTS